MGTIINFKCEKCNFNFKDKDLIFYLNENDEIIEETLTQENSNMMTKSNLKGFLYETYCPHCKELIKTYVPEGKNLTTEECIIKKISKYNKNSKFKILFFDFDNSTYKNRRKILENNICPNCNNNISLVTSEKTICPKCGSKLIED